jgi:hypothetical protein
MPLYFFSPLSELEHFDKTAPTGTYSVVDGGHIIPLEKPDLIGKPRTTLAYYYQFIMFWLSPSLAAEIMPTIKKVLGSTTAPELSSKLWKHRID